MKQCIFCKDDYDKENEKCKNPDCGLSNQPRILVDFEISKLLKRGVIRIQPVLDEPTQLCPFGIDLTLDTRFKKVIKSNNISINPIAIPESEDQYYETVELLFGNDKDHYVLHPGEFALGQSFEFISLPNFIVGGLDGKSSLGRLGVTVHTTAASVDQGFSGHITFELYNTGSLPIVLTPLQPVARLVLHLTSPANKPYSGKYSAQTEVRSSQYHNSTFAGILRKRIMPLP